VKIKVWKVKVALADFLEKSRYSVSYGCVTMLSYFFNALVRTASVRTAMTTDTICLPCTLPLARHTRVHAQRAMLPAVERHCLEDMQMCIDAGATPTPQVLKTAVRLGEWEMVKLLFDHSTPRVRHSITTNQLVRAPTRVMSVLFDAGVNPHTIVLHRIGDNRNIIFGERGRLLESFGVDLTRPRMYYVRTMQELIDFRAAYPHANEFVDIDFLANCLATRCPRDMVNAVMDEVSATYQYDTYSFTRTLKYARRRSVVDALFNMTKQSLPDFAQLGMKYDPGFAPIQVHHRNPRPQPGDIRRAYSNELVAKMRRAGKVQVQLQQQQQQRA